MPLTPIALQTYIAILMQTGTNNPTTTVLKNTMGTVTWSRDSTGLYIGQTIIPNSHIDKMHIPYAMGTVGNSFACIPLTDYGTITGYVLVNIYTGTTNLQITVEILNNSFAYTDLSTLSNGAKLRLPEIQYFYN